MTRPFAFALLLAAALTAACSSKPAEPPAETAAEPAPAATAAAPPAGAPAKLEITEPLVGKYMQYQKEVAVIVAQYAAESRKNLESAKGDAAKILNQVNLNQQAAKELENRLAAKRKEMGLSEGEFTLLQEAVGMIANARSLYNQMGGDAQVARIEAEQKKSLAAMPADQRPAAEAEMAKMTESLRQLRDGFELRKKFGDQAADVLLKKADALAAQYEENLKLMAGK